MNDHDKYEAWKAQFYEAVRANAPETLGQPIDSFGDFEHGGFQLGADYGKVGDDGGMIVTVALKGHDLLGLGRFTQEKANWRNDDPQYVARAAIAKFIRLRQQHL